jgi:hypothetical protein
MALQAIGKNNVPSYLALSSDVEDNATIPGAYRIGHTVYLTDLAEYRLILPSLKLIPFAYSNGTAGVLPEFVSAEVGTVDDVTVVLTLNEDVVASDYALGFTIKKNDVEQTISSATRQTDHAVIYFVLADAVEEGDSVNIEYNMSDGGIVSETGTVYLENISSEEVTNNVVAP